MSSEGEETTTGDAPTTVTSTLGSENDAHPAHPSPSEQEGQVEGDLVESQVESQVENRVDNNSSVTDDRSDRMSTHSERKSSASSVQSLNVSSMEMSIDLRNMDDPDNAFKAAVRRVKAFFDSRRRLKVALAGGVVLLLLVVIGGLSRAALDDGPKGGVGDVVLPDNLVAQGGGLDTATPLVQDPATVTRWERMKAFTRRKVFLVPMLLVAVAVVATAITLTVLHLTADPVASEAGLEPADPPPVVDLVGPAEPVIVYDWTPDDWPILLAIYLFISLSCILWLWLEGAADLPWSALLFQTIAALLLGPLCLLLCLFGIAIYGLASLLVQPAKASPRPAVRFVCKVLLAIFMPIGLFFLLIYAGFLKLCSVVRRGNEAKIRLQNCTEKLQKSWKDFWNVYRLAVPSPPAVPDPPVDLDPPGDSDSIVDLDPPGDSDPPPIDPLDD